MTSIVYKKRFESHLGESSAMILKELSGIGIDEVLIEIEDSDGAHIRIGDERALIKGGCARLNLSALNDGLYTPVVTSGTRSLLCSPFIKRQGVLLRPLPDGGDISRLEELISELYRRFSALSAEVDSLKRKSEAQSSFDL